MRKIVVFSLVFFVICGLSGCRGKNDNTSSFTYSSSKSDFVSSMDNNDVYVNLTIDENNQIIDSVTGLVITDDKLYVDSNGNIVLRASGKIVVTAEQVLKNREQMNSAQNTTQSSSIGAGSSSKSNIASSSSNSSSNQSEDLSSGDNVQNVNYDYRGTKWYSFYYAPYTINFPSNPKTYDYYILQIFDIQSDHFVYIHTYTYLKLNSNQGSGICQDVINGTIYTRIAEDAYLGYCIKQNDGIKIKLCCNGANREAVSNEFSFKRFDVNSLRLISNTENSFLSSMKTGESFTRNLEGETTINPVSSPMDEYFNQVFHNVVVDKSEVDKYGPDFTY